MLCSTGLSSRPLPCPCLSPGRLSPMTCLDLAGLWNQPAPPEAPMMPTHLCSEPLKLTPARVTQGHTLMSRVGLGVLIMLPRASTPSAQPPELFSMTAAPGLALLEASGTWSRRSNVISLPGPSRQHLMCLLPRNRKCFLSWRPGLARVWAAAVELLGANCEVSLCSQGGLGSEVGSSSPSVGMC